MKTDKYSGQTTDTGTPLTGENFTVNYPPNCYQKETPEIDSLELKLRKKVYSQIDYIRDHVNKFGSADENGNIYCTLSDMELILDLLWKDE